MKVFLSHARKDNRLARALSDCLELEGFSVWDPQTQIFPGDNWARKVAKAYDSCEMMVVLITPGSDESDAVKRDVEFALGSEHFADRVFSVLVGPAIPAAEEVAWILLKLPHRKVRSRREFPSVVRDIQQMSHTHA